MIFLPGILEAAGAVKIPPILLEGNFGIFTDTGGQGGNYQNNEVSRWHIQALQPITLSFTSFSTELDYDFLTIYDGASQNAPILLNHSGNTIPAPINSTGNDLFIVFISNSSIPDSGWVANWEPTAILLSGESGIFTDTGGQGGNYQNNEVSRWHIQALQPITLSFSSFATEINDFLTIYDGQDETAPILLNHSGNTIPASINSTGNDLFIKFTSNSSSTNSGWLANWEPTPSSSTINLSGNSGSFAPVLIGGNYRSNRQDYWIIQATQPIRLTFTSFNTEFGFDKIIVYDGNSETAPILLTHSGNTIPAPINSTGNNLFIKFTTDANITNSGWVANWQPQPIFTLLTANTGTFRDSGGTGNYGNNETLYWKIKPANGQAVKLTFTAISILAGDALTIYDGENELSPILLNSYSGTTLPPVVKATGNVLFIKFTSDSSGVSSGWSANWSQNTDFTLVKNVPNLISQTYGANALIKWHIQGALSTKLVLAIPSSNIEEGSDFLYVHNGNSEQQAIILTQTGYAGDNPVLSTNNSLFLRFVSDSSVNGSFTFLYKYLSETILLGNAGSFSDPGGASNTNYQGWNIWHWIIAAKAPIRLTFSSFTIDQNYESITVYNGIGDSAPILLNQYAAPSPPPAINSTGNYLTIKFVSNINPSNAQWLANWQLQS